MATEPGKSETLCLARNAIGRIFENYAAVYRGRSTYIDWSGKQTKPEALSY